VGIKTQTPNVMDALSVHENVWLAARRFYNIAEARDRADAIIERLTLSAIARTQLGQLAHGERQRVELGIVAVADPWLVLLDEPAAGMSAQDVDRMTEIIHELTRFAAVVIVEHDMQFIRSIAQTVTVFHQGAVLMEDNVERVMSDPQVRAVYLGKKA
jgi:branched-chain amino acid transport system ATP-binding protein